MDYYEFPDPANEEEGCLNYAWNKKVASPIDGTIDPSSGFGYTTAACVDYYEKPKQPMQLDLTLPKNFGDWYYENWQWWDDILYSVTGAEQVRLIAEYFPELGPVCRRIWDGHDELMEAFEAAPFSKKETDFYRLLISLNSSGQSHKAARGISTRDSDLEENDYESHGRVLQRSRGED
jgi:hypothetical protein